MTSSINNATPMVYQLGIKDNSTTQGAVNAPAISSHLSHTFIYAQKGPIGRQLCDETNLVAMYGSDTFDTRKKYATHQTVLANTLAAAGNAQMIERLVPDDAGPKANFRLSLDVLPMDIPVYQRAADGTYLRDVDGALVPNGVLTTAGFKVKWVKTSITAGGPGVLDSATFGLGTSSVGTQTDGANTSTLYPVLEYYAGSYGAGGNNAGLRLSAPLSTDDSPANTALLDAIKAFPYRLQAITRATAVATPSVKSTLGGDSSIEFVLKAGQISPFTDASVSLGDVFKPAYESIGNPLRADIYADIPNVHIYTSNLNTLQTLFFNGEQAAMTDLEDIDGSDIALTDEAATDSYVFNLLTFKNSSGAQYRCIDHNTTDANSVVLGASTNLYCSGGSDGTMSDAAFNVLAAAKMVEYADPLSPVLDTATNPVSIMYDTGWELTTKYAMCSFLARRKDTFVVLSTYTQGADYDAAEEASIGISLRARLGLYPESSYFGTPVVRGLIMMRYGRMLGVNYAHKLPLTLELAAKAAGFMGAGSGEWNAAKLFDIAPRSMLTMFTDLNVSFVPASQRVVDWSTGLNYPISFSRDAAFFPAMKTAYNDDTSVLTSFFTAMGCVALQKVGEQVWREFSGCVHLTRAQLVANVNQAVINKTTGKFAGLFKVIPKAYISGGDALRGYSYTLPIEIHANNAQTVMTLSVEAYRMPAA